MALGALALRRSTSALWVGVAVLTVAAAAGGQPAQDRDRARVLADEAANAYARGEYARADVLLEHAYSLFPAPTVALLRARALVALKRWVEAIPVYQSAAHAKLGPDAGPVFRRASEDATSELVALELRLPRLRIQVAPSLLDTPSKVVRVDGRVIPSAQLGSWLPMDPKPHSLDLQIDGRTVQATTVVLGERDAITVPLGAPVSAPRASAPARSRAAPHRTWGTVSIGAGGALLGFGVVTGVVALDALADADRDCPERRCASGGSGAEALERFETFRTLSTIGYIAGAAGIATGTFVLLTAPRSEPEIGVSAFPGGLRMRGSW